MDIPNMQSVTYTVQFLSSGTHSTGQVPIYQIFWVIRQYPYSADSPQKV